MEPWSLFPGVYTQLVDTSFGVAASAGSTAFIVIMSERGPDNQLNLHSRVDELLTTYGTVDVTSYGQGLKIAIQYLRNSTSLYAIRVTPDHTNVASMSNIYNDLYGKFYKSQIEIREAAYANIGLATNESGEFTFIHVGPEDLGNIIALNVLTPPDNPKLNDRYFIPLKDPNTGYEAEATGVWKGHEGTIAICRSESSRTPDSKKWTYKEIKDTSLAKMNNVSMCAAVTYENLDPLALWRDYENVYMDDGSYTTVLDIVDNVPEVYEYNSDGTVKEDVYGNKVRSGLVEDGDSYLISLNSDAQVRDSNGVTTDLIQLLADASGSYDVMKVMTYSAELDEWQVSIYNKVFLDREYIVDDGTLASEPTVEVGDRFLVYVANKPAGVSEATYKASLPIPDWYDHVEEIAEKTASGWKYLTFDVADPEETDKFQSLVITVNKDSYEKLINENDTIDYTSYDIYSTTRIEYKKKNVFVKDIIWTADTNAAFCAYAHRMTQFNDIIYNASPDDSITNGSIEPFILFYPLGRGTFYNGVHIDMKLSSTSIHEESDFDKVLILDIYNTTDGNILKVESFEVSFNPNKKDLSGNSIFIEDIVNRYSNYVRCSINREIFNENSKFTQNIHSDLDILFSRYALRNKVGSTSIPPSFKHGDDGNIFDKYGNLDWNVAQQLLVKAYTGTIINPAALDQNNPYETDVLDKENVLFDLVFDAGYPRPVKVAIQTLIEARHQDCFGVIDLGDNASAKAAYEARRDGVGAPFNTPFIAIYEPYSLIYDEFSGRDIWISPVYHAARAIALTDLNYGRHHAPAGVKRGMCPEIQKLRYNLGRETAYQDLFVSYNINPIIQNRDGFLIWGQSTSYLKTSKFQDINVIRLVLRIKRDLEFALRDYIFDLNDEFTWQLMSGAVNGYLGNLVSEQALTSFDTQIYASDYDITRHRVRVDVMLNPKQVIYQVLLTISV